MSKGKGEDLFNVKRQQFTTQIRKQSRNQIIVKRRNYQPINTSNNNIQLTDRITQSSLQDICKKYLQHQYTINQLPNLIQFISTSDIHKIYCAVIGIRKLLSVQNNPPIQKVIDANIVTKLIQFIKQQKMPYLQLQATWALANLASGTTSQCSSLVDKGAISLFVKLLSSNDYGIAQQAVWAIGNIAGDCAQFRDLIISSNGIQPIINLIKNCQIQSIVKQSAWALSNLCRGNPLPKYDGIRLALPILAHILKNASYINDIDILIDCSWALSYMSDGPKSRLQNIIQTGIIPTLNQYLNFQNIGLLVPCLRTIGNIALGNQYHAQQLLKHKVLKSLYKLLDCDQRIIKRQTCWILSNLAASGKNQVQQIIKYKQLINKLIKLWQKQEQPDVNFQISWIFSNMTYSGDCTKLIQFYIQHKIVEMYLIQMESIHFKLIDVSLESLKCLLQVGSELRRGQNLILRQIQKYKGVQKLQGLQFHESDEIYKKVAKILQIYFELEEVVI